MPPQRKPSGQVVQDNEAITGSDEAPVNGETGPVLGITYVTGKNPEVRSLPVTNPDQGVSDPGGE